MSDTTDPTRRFVAAYLPGVRPDVALWVANEMVMHPGETTPSILARLVRAAADEDEARLVAGAVLGCLAPRIPDPLHEHTLHALACSAGDVLVGVRRSPLGIEIGHVRIPADFVTEANEHPREHVIAVAISPSRWEGAWAWGPGMAGKTVRQGEAERAGVELLAQLGATVMGRGET